MDISGHYAADYQHERNEQEDGVCGQSGGIGFEQHCQRFLMTHLVHVPLYERVRVEDIGHEHTYGKAQHQYMPCKAVLGEESTACRLIDAANQTRTETQTDYQFTQAMETEFEGRCRVEEAEESSNSRNDYERHVEVARNPDNQSAKESQSKEHGNSSTQLP